MAKTGKTVFFCQNCGYESSKWAGQCPACKEWNTFVEEAVKPVKSSSQVKLTRDIQLSTFSTISIEKDNRIITGISELDRVLGGGIVRGSLVLVGGDPGIGKSTLLLQVCERLCKPIRITGETETKPVYANTDRDLHSRNTSAVKQEVQGRENFGPENKFGCVHTESNSCSMDNISEQEPQRLLYVSGEESLRQIKLRALRIGEFTENVELLCETDLDTIRGVIENRKPDVVIIDSIQTMYNEAVASSPGSVSQVRETTNVLMQIAKGMGISIFIVGHVTKEGTVAGPKVLEHMVDTVLYFEGEKNASYRILRGVKNRFGSTNEIGVFEMSDKGLIEVQNPSEYMLQGRPEGASGSVVACSLEGTRPILIEIQALVCKSGFNLPRRTATGCDFNRVNLLMAVLEKRVGLKTYDCDAYVNLAGGIRINEPAMDLGIVMAILSSFRNVPISSETIIFGEVGLSGEVRAVSLPKVRVSEAKKLGFKRCIIPSVCFKAVKDVEDIEIIGVSSVADAMKYL